MEFKLIREKLFYFKNLIIPTLKANWTKAIVLLWVVWFSVAQYRIQNDINELSDQISSLSADVATQDISIGKVNMKISGISNAVEIQDRTDEIQEIKQSVNRLGQDLDGLKRDIELKETFKALRSNEK